MGVGDLRMMSQIRVPANLRLILAYVHIPLVGLIGGAFKRRV